MATGVPSKRRVSKQAYGLQYAGKLARADVLALPAAEPVEIAIASEAGRLFQGDNLPAMLWLRSDPGVRGKVRTVYIDPPYATAMAFVDREAKHAYDDHLDGAEYLEFLRRRLIVLHDLLAAHRHPEEGGDADGDGLEPEVAEWVVRHQSNDPVALRSDTVFRSGTSVLRRARSRSGSRPTST